MEVRLLQLRLLSLFYEQYRVIWVQYGKFSTCVTLFPIDRNQSYKIITAPRQLNRFNELAQLINEKAY